MVSVTGTGNGVKTLALTVVAEVEPSGRVERLNVDTPEQFVKFLRSIGVV
jgi:cell envelope opacity-associated protein A